MNNRKNKPILHIPCVYLDIHDINMFMGSQISKVEEEKGSSTRSFRSSVTSDNSKKKIMLYFHGNAEDVGHNMMLLMTMRE